MLALASASGGSPTPLTQIADSENISLAYLEQLVAALRRRGLVESGRGARGGYLLAQPPEHITLGDVLRAADEPLGPVDCVDGSGKGSCCDRASDCAARPAWERLHDTVAGLLDATTLAELAQSRAQRRGSGLPAVSSDAEE